MAKLYFLNVKVVQISKKIIHSQKFASKLFKTPNRSFRQLQFFKIKVKLNIQSLNSHFKITEYSDIYIRKLGNLQQENFYILGN